jgi:pimeloyl-ACP methyl ester carboxylesterase
MLCPRLQHLYFRYPSIETIDKIEIPILVMHGTGDVMIPVTHGKRLFDAYVVGRRSKGQCQDQCEDGQLPSKYIEIEGAGHDDLFMTKEWMLEVPAFMTLTP